MTSTVSMHFFADHYVPESACKTLENAGYKVERLRDKTAPDSSDNLVAAIAAANNAILVTMDRDFKTMIKRQGIGNKRFRTLSLLRFEKCRESRAAERIDAAMSLIEHEWNVAQGNRDRRLFVVICDNSLRTYR